MDKVQLSHYAARFGLYRVQSGVAHAAAAQADSLDPGKRRNAHKQKTQIGLEKFERRNLLQSGTAPQPFARHVDRESTGHCFAIQTGDAACQEKICLACASV
jgi:hypothetical protein